MLLNKDELKTCPLIYSLSMINGKWKPFIIWYLNLLPDHCCRYGALKRKIPWELSHKMFTQQLKELELDGMILRKEYDENPPKVEYVLTEKGLCYATAVALLRDLGAYYGNDFDSAAIDRTIGEKQDNKILYFHSSERGDAPALNITLTL